MPPKQTNIKSTVLPIFIQASDLPTDDGPIYGLEIKRAMEMVIGKDKKIECVQKCNGLWRLYLWTKQDRNTILQTGLSLRGHSISVSSENPNSYQGKDTVWLYISNVYYSIADEEVSKALRNIGLVVIGKIKWENYRDEKRNLLDTKTGRRYVRISQPTNPLPEFVRIADTINGYISYYGQKQAELLLKSDSLANFDYTKDNSKTEALVAARAFPVSVNGSVGAEEIEESSESSHSIGGDEEPEVVSEPLHSNSDSVVVVKPLVAEPSVSVASLEGGSGLVSTNPFFALNSLGDQGESSELLNRQEGNPTTDIPAPPLPRSRLPYRKGPGEKLRSQSSSKTRSLSVGSTKRKGARSDSTSKKQRKDQPSVLSFLYNTDCACTDEDFESNNSKTSTSLKSFDKSGFDWFDLKYT